IPYNSFALDACVPDDSVALVFDYSKNANDYCFYGCSWCGYNCNGLNKGQFSARHSYSPGGYIYGMGACLTSNYQWGDNKAILIDNGSIVVGGEQNGQYCFCKLTFPVVSQWVLIDAGSYFDGINRHCETECHGSCGWHTVNGSILKRFFSVL
ncbi:MAG: hypothetical protein IJL05_04240, partial [Alphaproteobacteria bacterium]|nr:hypothetical protein [Alphaproteobacteria bacterium]